MDRLGYPEGAVAIQMEKLRFFGAGNPKKMIRLQSPDRVYKEEMEDRVRAEPWKEVKPDEFPEKVVWGMLADSSDDEKVEAAGSSEKPKIVSMGTYVVSIIGRSKRRALHRVGECHRVPGVHYFHYEIIGSEPPALDRFHQSCKICFPRGTSEHSDSESAELGSDDCSSSDSSTSVEGSE